MKGAARRSRAWAGTVFPAPWGRRQRRSIAAPEIEGYWELPARHPIPGTAVAISGWLFSRTVAVRGLALTVNGGADIPVAHALPRPDVARAFGVVPAAGASGFATVLPSVPRGPLHMVIWATLADGDRVPCFERRMRVGRAWHQGLAGWLHLLRGAAGKAIVAYRAGRLAPSPRAWLRLVRVYHRELTGDVGPGLGPPPAPARGSAAVPALEATSPVVARVHEALHECEQRLGRDPAILDWCSGLPLAAALSRYPVFSPPPDSRDARWLPYLDGTVDVVVMRAGPPAAQAEARRVAGLAVLTVEDQDGRPSRPGAVTVEWRTGAANPSERVSIIIPVFDNAAYTNACLQQVLATLPASFDGEIIVVDDASTDYTGAVLERWTARDPRVIVVRNPQNLGFLHSANRGAHAARGDVLVFLNNDTLPQPGWLPPLLRVLRERPDAGAVGGKLLYPDGRLQEAGGVVFADGSAANFGKQHPAPNAELYSYVREVDYCSGALLATWRALFLELGGFDVRYAPAYYEDTDFCFCVRRAGRRVYYQPESVVIHFEGASAGTSLHARVKHHQVINRGRFVEKWDSALSRHHSAPDSFDWPTAQRVAVRDPSTPRALVCAPRLPEFDRESGSQRILHLVELLLDAGWAVSFVAMSDAGRDRYARPLQQLGVATYAGADRAGEAAVDVRGLIAHGRFAVAILSFWNVAERIMPLVRSLSPDTRVIVDSVDLHFLRNARGGGGAAGGRTAGDRQVADECRGEMMTYAAADAVLTVSEHEADVLSESVGGRQLAYAVPDLESASPSPFSFAERAGIVFVGNFRHAPNVEALKYLSMEVVPRLPPALLAAHPVSVVGNALETVASVDTGRHVRWVGWVPSVIPYLQRARLSVVPLLRGAGTKRKLIQALMVGTPTVSTSVGVEGLELADNGHVLVADDPATFAAGIVQLAEDGPRWERLAAAGRAHIRRHHSPDVVRERFLAVLEAVRAIHAGDESTPDTGRGAPRL